MQHVPCGDKTDCSFNHYGVIYKSDEMWCLSSGSSQHKGRTDMVTEQWGGCRKDRALAGWAHSGEASRFHWELTEGLREVTMLALGAEVSGPVLDHEGLGKSNAKVRTGCPRPLKNFMRDDGLVHLIFSKVGIKNVEGGMDGTR